MCKKAWISNTSHNSSNTRHNSSSTSNNSTIAQTQLKQQFNNSSNTSNNNSTIAQKQLKQQFNNSSNTWPQKRSLSLHVADFETPPHTHTHTHIHNPHYLFVLRSLVPIPYTGLQLSFFFHNLNHLLLSDTKSLQSLL